MLGRRSFTTSSCDVNHDTSKKPSRCLIRGSRKGNCYCQKEVLLFFSSSEGFNRVFLMEKLSSFSHKEVQMILCGNQSPSWTADDIINYTEPKLGYTRDRYVLAHLKISLLLIFSCGPNLFFFLLFSPGFLRFVRVLCGMSSDERKAFLQFTTGCSTLPPGGLANLHPRLTIVRKVKLSQFCLTCFSGDIKNLLCESDWLLPSSG